MEERPLWVSPAVVFLSYLYQLPPPPPPKIFTSSFCRNPKGKFTTPEQGAALSVGIVYLEFLEPHLRREAHRAKPSASAHHPLVEFLLHRFSVVIPPFSVKCNAHVSVCRRQLRSHLWIYFGDRFLVYRRIWDEFGEPMVVLCGYAVGDQFHRLLFFGCSFRNYQVVGS